MRTLEKMKDGEAISVSRDGLRFEVICGDGNGKPREYRLKLQEPFSAARGALFFLTASDFCAESGLRLLGNDCPVRILGLMVGSEGHGVLWAHEGSRD